ncbi:MAG: gluconate 2-dehydrogenase subunit 3 family protein [Chitinophagaceae bacterium]
MDRRKSLKVIALGTVSTSVLLNACKSPDKKAEQTAATPPASTIDRMQEEAIADKKIASEKFFDGHEMATIAVLCDIIIPADEISGSATDAKVPDFIEFIVKDMPKHQTPLRGGLRWLDMQSVKRFEKPFRDCGQEQQLQLVDEIAYPQKAKPEMKQGVSFFNLMRNLTATGFYTSEIGIKDIGYMGNKPNQWNGVPDEVLKQYNIAYTEKELKECISF